MIYNFPMTVDRRFKNTLEDLHNKYGDKMMELEGMSPSQLDACNFMANFMGTNTVADASIDDNANVGNKTVTTMINESNKPFLKLLSRNKIFIEMAEEFGVEDAKTFLEWAVNGRLYEHDSHLSSFYSYCFAFSLKNIVSKGLYFLTEMKAEPPKHWDTFNHHTLEFISYATNQLAGAVAIPDYLIYAYYFFKKDTEGMSKDTTEKYRDQKFQEIIFNLNQPYLKGSTQSAYTNFSILDRMHIVKFFGNEYYPDGSMITEHLFEILEFQKAFLNYAGRLRQTKWYTFPVLSASLIFKDGAYEDEDTAKSVIKHNWEYGFNDVNIMNVEEATRMASCCRLVSNKDEINSVKDTKIFNSIGGSDVNVGSTKVVTLNLVRHALEARGYEDLFYDEVIKSLDIIHKYHYAQRNCLKKLIKKGMLPLYTYGMMSLDDQFATVGINGVFEAIKILGGIDETSTGYQYNGDGYAIAKKLFNLINTPNEKTFNKYGYLSNVEQVPAESAAIKLCKKDRLLFGNREINKELGEDCYIYGNQWIPLKENASLFARIESARLDKYCGGGAIQHINLGERFECFEDAYEFAVGLASMGVGYYSEIAVMDICKDDHTFFGDTCPICGGKSESKGVKVVGYMVKRNSFSKERRKELDERKFYKMSDISN